MLYTYGDKLPRVHPSVWLADGVKIVGDVQIGESCSVWYNAVLRGDLAPIIIGAGTNIQDGCIGHVNVRQPLIVGRSVSVGHAAVIHGCVIGDGSLIGMGATVLNGAEIGEYVLIGAGALVPENRKIPPYTLVLGSPGKVVRELTDDDISRMKRTSESYVVKSAEYAAAAGLVRKVERHEV